VTFRVAASTPNHRRPADPAPAAPSAPDPIRHRPVWFEAAGGFVRCPVYDRARIGTGATIHGPAIIEQMDSTTVVTGNDSVTGLDAGNLLLRVGSEAGSAPRAD
jgi:N-methylhydantoinase A